MDTETELITVHVHDAEPCEPHPDPREVGVCEQGHPIIQVWA